MTTTTPPAWVRDSVFYQIFPDRFARTSNPALIAASPYGSVGALEPWESPPTAHGFKGGDLFGVAERLDELVDLGVNALYLNPIFSSASNHRYHAYDYLAVDPLLGGDAGLRALLDAAHALGIRVVLDGVFNHSGRGFWPFHHLLEAGRDSPYRDWFALDPDVRAGRRPLNAYPRARAGTGHEPGLGYEAWWGLPALPKLNVANPATAEYLWRVGEHWLRFGIDGWRLDVPDEIRVQGFWETFRQRCLAVNPECYFVGEIWEHAPEWLNGRFDGLMNYPLGAAILGFAGGSHLHAQTIGAHHTYSRTISRLDPQAFASALEVTTTVYPGPTIEAQLNLVGSHDTPRVGTVMGGDRDAVRCAYLLLLTLPGAPTIYYGDEIGMLGGDDPACRGAFPSDPGAGDRDLRATVRSLIAARTGNVALRRGTARVMATGRTSVAILREVGDQHALVLLNPGDESDRVELPMQTADGLRSLPIDGWTAAEAVRISDGPSHAVEVGLPPQSGAILVG
jgi:neopullulanase